MQPNTYPIYQHMKYFHWNLILPERRNNEMLYGIDLSNWNNPSDAVLEWADFCVVKATEGKSFTDKLMNKHLGRFAAAKKDLMLNTCFGTYHFARPDSGNDYKTEAENYLLAIDKFIGYGIMVLDIEGQAAVPEYAEWAFNWMRYVFEETGVKPLLYTSASNLHMYNRLYDFNCGLWVANYKKKGNAFPNVLPHTTGIWPTLAMWQWTNGTYEGDSYNTRSDGQMSWFKERLDQNIFNGDVVAWKRYARGSAVPTQHCTYCPIHCPGDEY